MTLCYTPIQLILQMLYICYRSRVTPSFARAMLAINIIIHISQALLQGNQAALQQSNILNLEL